MHVTKSERSRKRINIEENLLFSCVSWTYELIGSGDVKNASCKEFYLQIWNLKRSERKLWKREKIYDFKFCSFVWVCSLLKRFISYILYIYNMCYHMYMPCVVYKLAIFFFLLLNLICVFKLVSLFNYEHTNFLFFKV